MCLDHPGPEESMEPAALWVPGSPTCHRHHVTEGPQGASRSKNDAAGERHQSNWEVQDHLLTQLAENNKQYKEWRHAYSKCYVKCHTNLSKNLYVFMHCCDL